MGTDFEEKRRKKGPRGLADVKVLKNSIKVAFPELKKVAELAPEDKDVPVVTDAELMVELNGDENYIYRCHPYSGSHFVKLHSFVRMGEEPEPTTFTVPAHHVGPLKDGREWDEPDREKFSVLLEIVGDGKYKGMLVPYALDYLVDRADDDTVKFVGGRKRLSQLREFLVIAGFDPANDNLKYEDNILPALEDLLLSRGQVFLALIDGGWVNSLTRAPIGQYNTKKKRTSKKKEG
jgi:hypothetical protein